MKNLTKSFLAALLVLAFSIIVYSQTTTSLEPGKLIEQTIAGSETHTYNLTFAKGSYGLVEVNQKSINLSITVFAADGQKIRVIDLTGVGFLEQLSLIAGDTTNYRIEVHGPDKASPSGGYAIKLNETHPATDQDKARVEAEKLTEAGMQILINERTHASRLQAIEKFQQSITFWRAAKDNVKEAGSFYLLSYSFNEVSEYQKAYDAAKQGLPLAQAARDQQTEAWLRDQIGSAYNGLGESKKALESFLQALPLRQSTKDPVGLGNTLNNLGMAYNAIGDLQKSLYYLEQVPPIMREMREHLKASTVLGNICVLHITWASSRKPSSFVNRD